MAAWNAAEIQRARRAPKRAGIDFSPTLRSCASSWRE